MTATTPTTGAPDPHPPERTDAGSRCRCCGKPSCGCPDPQHRRCSFAWFPPVAPAESHPAPVASPDAPTGPAQPDPVPAVLRTLTGSVTALTTVLATTGPASTTGLPEAVVALADAAVALADCCRRFEAAAGTVNDRAGRRMLQATGDAEHLATRLCDTAVALDRT